VSAVPKPTRLAVARAEDPAVAAWRALVQALPDAAWVVALPALRVVTSNAAAAQLLGTLEDQAYWDEAVHGTAGQLLSDTVLLAADGHALQMRRAIQPLLAPGARTPTHCLVTLLDISGWQAAVAAQEDAVAELQATLESTADGILVTDLGGRVRAFNHRFAQLWAMPEDLLSQHHHAAVQDWMRRMVQDPQAYQRRLDSLQEATLVASTERLTLLSGQVLERVARPLWSRGRPLGRVWSFRDLSERLAADQQLETLARTDDLTGLPNRRRLHSGRATRSSTWPESSVRRSVEATRVASCRLSRRR